MYMYVYTKPDEYKFVAVLVVHFQTKMEAFKFILVFVLKVTRFINGFIF